MLDNQVLKDKLGESSQKGSSRSSASTVHSNSSLMAGNSKYKSTGQVTDVSGRLFEVFENEKGKLFTVREDGQRIEASASQVRRRMKPDPICRYLP